MRFDKEFSFGVGLDERHQITCSWAQAVGLFVVKVDGVEVLKKRKTFGFRRLRRYELSVGTSEVHAVVIEKRLRIERGPHPTPGGLREQDFSVLVDGRLIGQF